MDLVEFDPPDRELLIQDAKTYLEDARRHFAVEDLDQYNSACADLKAVKRRLNAVKDDRLERTKPLTGKLNEIRESYRDAEKFLQDAERILKSAIGRWDRRQAEIAEGERRRQLAERRAEQQRIEAEAKQLRESGDHLTADRLDRDIAELPVATIARPTYQGISTSERWHVEIVDLDAIPRQYLIPDLRRLNELARALKTEFCVPGTRAVCDPSVSVRT